MPHEPQTPAAAGRSPHTGSRRRSPLEFLFLVFALAIPFWLLGGATGRWLLPGLPVSALAVVCPALAASILVYRERRRAGVAQLLRRSFDCDRIRAKRWYAPIVLLVPGVTVLTYGLMRWMRWPVPAPELAILPSLALLVAFFVGALGEELGWSGYAIDPLQERWGALGAGLLLGFAWAAWHVVPLVQVQRAPAWIAAWCVYTVAGRVLLTWLYNNTGKSVFAAALYHAVSNVSWQLFPSHGSHWDPRLTGLILALAAAGVTVAWGPRTLAEYRGLRVLPRAGARRAR